MVLDGSSSVFRVDRSRSRLFRRRLASVYGWCAVATGGEVSDSGETVREEPPRMWRMRSSICKFVGVVGERMLRRLWRGIGGAISGGEERRESVWVVGVGSAEDDGEMGVKGCVGEDWRNSVMSSCVDGGSVLQEYGGERLRIPSAMA